MASNRRRRLGGRYFIATSASATYNYYVDYKLKTAVSGQKVIVNDNSDVAFFDDTTLITSLDLRGLRYITRISAGGLRSLSSINISGLDLSRLIGVDLSSTALTTFTLSSSSVESLNFIFCSNLTSIDLSGCSNIKSLIAAFGCSSLSTLNIKDVDPTKLTGYAGMFAGCNSAVKITCSLAFKNWAIKQDVTITLPEPLKSASSSQWIVV